MRNDLDTYEQNAGEWWNPGSRAFRSLQSVNRFRVALIREWFGDRLPGALVIDLGCGGGLLAEPILQAGARVLGIDLSRASLSAAASRPLTRPRMYVAADLTRSPVASAVADAVLLADVLEHVTDVAAAVSESARLLKQGGLLYVNTINRTTRARVLAVTVAEGLRLIPPGTHDPRLFVRPDDLRDVALRNGLRVVRLQGESPAVLATLRQWAITLQKCRSVAVAYSALFEKI